MWGDVHVLRGSEKGSPRLLRKEEHRLYIYINGAAFPDSLTTTQSLLTQRLGHCEDSNPVVAMAFTTVFCLSLLAALRTAAQSTCTTLQPVFELPFDGTSTVYGSTITSTGSVDCGGCSLVVSTFRAVVETSVSDLPVLTPPALQSTNPLVP